MKVNTSNVFTGHGFLLLRAAVHARLFHWLHAVATSALATDNLGQGVLVQRFDSAKHTPGQGPLYSVYPMSPSLISVNTGVLYGAAPTQAEVAAGAAAARSLGLSTTAAPRGLNVNSCGYKCNGPSASPLPPSGFTAWSSMIYRANAGNSALWGSNF